MGSVSPVDSKASSSRLTKYPVGCCPVSLVWSVPLASSAGSCVTRSGLLLCCKLRLIIEYSYCTAASGRFPLCLASQAHSIFRHLPFFPMFPVLLNLKPYQSGRGDWPGLLIVSFSIPKDFIAVLSILSFSFMENSLDWIVRKYEMGKPQAQLRNTQYKNISLTSI